MAGEQPPMTARELYHTVKQTRDEAQCLAAIATFRAAGYLTEGNGR